MVHRSGSPPDECPSLSRGWAISIAVHLCALGVFLLLQVPPVSYEKPSELIFNVMDDPMLAGPASEEQAAGAVQDAVSPTRQAVSEPPLMLPSDPERTVEAAREIRVDDHSDVLNESQLIGALNAAEGGTGGRGGAGCNIAQALQRALQGNPLVRRAVEVSGRSGMAVSLWNGDWVRAGMQDGKGLSGVRQAIVWELAFAPEACRKAPMHGLVLLTLDDGTRFAIGAAAWRWSDLLGLG